MDSLSFCVAAITAITGFSLGAEAGFLTGALSAFVSNILFGQGPWTPFQMFFWGMIGFIAGLFSHKKNIYTSKLFILLFSLFAGVFFSFGMDIWGIISLSGFFSWQAYVVASGTALPFTIVYIVGSLVFLLLLLKPLTEKLNRMKTSMGFFREIPGWFSRFIGRNITEMKSSEK